MCIKTRSLTHVITDFTKNLGHVKISCLDRRNGDVHMLYRDPKSMLFEAIFHGNSSQVKQLINPCLGRSALHWACMGNQYQIVCHLISNGADVNITDKDSVSPLIRAAMAKNTDLVKLLIDKGANVNQTDRLRCSALHYATVHGDKELIRTVIFGGCVLNNEAIIGKGTPMCNLLHKRDVNNCLLLLEAGYNASKEFILMTRDDDVIEPVIKEVKGQSQRFQSQTIM
ncbi:hypothetical protein FSP39_017940 [Pinctada imbricata]|uniref:Uncharacterized protein n=1 Tax=Pinctada imbricata TaxID=66713 RepID=A0AA88Y555_PINIB|nr:hypothetical protein FSP39_017940 [Pinctada imbricata]